MKKKILTACCLLLAICACTPGLPSTAVSEEQLRQQTEMAMRAKAEAAAERDRQRTAELEAEQQRQRAMNTAVDEEALGQAAETEGRLRVAFDHYLRALHALPPGEKGAANALQQRIVMVAGRLDPPPAIPEEARRHVARGMAALEMADAPSGFDKARDEFRQALKHSPWVADIHYNLGLVAEKAEAFAEAIASYNLYLLAAPQAPDREAIRQRIYGLEFKLEEKSRQLAERQGWLGNWVTAAPARMVFNISGNVTRETRQQSALIYVLITSISDAGEVTALLSPGLWQSRCLDGSLGGWKGSLTDSGLVLKLPAGSQNLENRDVTTSNGGELHIFRQAGGHFTRLSTSCEYVSPGMLGGDYRASISFDYQGAIQRQGK